MEGKDGLNLFYRLCKQLQIDCQLIVDFDVLVGGNLRQSVSNDERCSQYLQRRGIGMEPIKAVGELLQKVDSCIKDLLKLTLDSITSTQIQQLYNSLVKLPSPEDLGKKRYLFILSVLNMKGELQKQIKKRYPEINLINGRLNQIIEGFRLASVYILPKGQLENYLKVENHYEISDRTKNILSHEERNYLLQNSLTENELRDRYDSLLDILDSVTGVIETDFRPSLEKRLIDFIFAIQKAVRFHRIKNLHDLTHDREID